MSDEGFTCLECSLVFSSSCEHYDHLRNEHRAQQVVCAWCTELKTFLNPSSLRRHLKNTHPALEEEWKLCGSGTLYYYAVNPSLYRHTAVNVAPPQLEEAKRAMTAIRLWVDTVGSAEASSLLQQAEEDWAKMGPMTPVVKQEKKRVTEIPALPSPKHRSHELQAEDFTISKINLSTAGADVILSSFLHGRYDLAVVAGETPSRALLRRFDKANPDSIITPSSADRQ